MFANAKPVFRCTTTSTVVPFCVSATVPKIVPAGPQPPVQWSLVRLNVTESAWADGAVSTVRTATKGTRNKSLLEVEIASAKLMVG